MIDAGQLIEKTIYRIKTIQKIKWMDEPLNTHYPKDFPTAEGSIMMDRKPYKSILI